MTKKQDSLALLPNGFVDLLPPYAQGEANSIQTLMDRFTAFGYRRIKPPMLEFEDSLLAPGPGEQLSSETFRLMDPVTHRMLGVRADITAQVSRIVSSRLQNEPRPLRLTYANDVLRTRGSQMRTERQFVQVGCELIGNIEGVQSDIEICVLALLGLKSLEIEDITLDLTIPGFVRRLLGDTPLNQVTVIEKAVKQRDVEALEAMEIAEASVIAQVIGTVGSAKDALGALEKIDLPVSLQEDLVRLRKVYQGIVDVMADLKIDDVSLTMDVLEQCGFEYHKSLGFTLFSSNIRGELGRGGCYDVHFGQGEDDELARGFTLYMDTISRSKTSFPEEKRVFVSADEPWSTIIEIQEQGWIVVRGASENEKTSECSHVYRNGKIQKLG